MSGVCDLNLCLLLITQAQVGVIFWGINNAILQKLPWLHIWLSQGWRKD